MISITDRIQIHDLNAARYVGKYQIAQAVPSDSAITYTDLAAKVKVDVSQLKRMLRQLINIHIFNEPQPDQVSHSASSKLILHWGVGKWFEYMIKDTFEMAAAQIPAIEKWGHGAQEPNEAALNYCYNTDKRMFQYYDEVPEKGQRFSTLMTYVSGMYTMSNVHIADGFDWASLPAGSTVVDVGGNVGHCSIAIAKANPSVKCTIQDLPSMISRASDPATSVIPEELRARFSFMPHDFFTPQPVKNAAVYFLRMIMHDYSDKYCRVILRHIVDAMGPDSKIVIMDQVLPPVGAAPKAIERIMRTMDLQMIMLSNAKERDYAEWIELLAGVDSRLQIRNVKMPLGSAMSLVEVGLRDGHQTMAMTNGAGTEPNGEVNGHA